MPKAPSKKEFQILKDNLQEFIDVDASDGREVPLNMNFVDEGYLTKDSGFTLLGRTSSIKVHSIFNYKKKNGDSFLIRGRGTKIQLYNYFDRTWTDIVNSPTFTENAEFGYIVYDDYLYFGNAVESLYKWDGTTFTEYASAPKGNILEVFEDRLFVSGVSQQPLALYYSNVGSPGTFTPADIVNPLGTDSITNLKNYYGTLLVFKQESIWKLTFVYEQILSSFVPKLEQQSGVYGACSRKAVSWVENDIWFFTGREVRSIGYTETISGVFGINKSVISENIKETLKLIKNENLPKIITFYYNRRFYLGVPVVEDTVDVVFVCHTLYKNSWTKYSGRDKSNVNDFLLIDEEIYTATSTPPYVVLKWNVTEEDSEDLNYLLATE